MEELKQKMDLILQSKVVVQSSVIKLNNKIDLLDQKFEKNSKKRIKELMH